MVVANGLDEAVCWRGLDGGRILYETLVGQGRVDVVNGLMIVVWHVYDVHLLQGWV